MRPADRAGDLQLPQRDVRSARRPPGPGRPSLRRPPRLRLRRAPAPAPARRGRRPTAASALATSPVGAMDGGVQRDRLLSDRLQLRQHGLRRRACASAARTPASAAATCWSYIARRVLSSSVPGLGRLSCSTWAALSAACAVSMAAAAVADLAAGRVDLRVQLLRVLAEPAGVLRATCRAGQGGFGLFHLRLGLGHARGLGRRRDAGQLCTRGRDCGLGLQLAARPAPPVQLDQRLSGRHRDPLRRRAPGRRGRPSQPRPRIRWLRWCRRTAIAAAAGAADWSAAAPVSRCRAAICRGARRLRPRASRV